ncbi:hypothetical protein NE645_18455, partial [Roseburia hominis]|nr:hypothetical protein [Roseburia hominis]
TIGLETRVLHPMLGRKQQREKTDWNTATDLIANGISQIATFNAQFPVIGWMIDISCNRNFLT